MTEFTASNGLTVEQDAEGWLCLRRDGKITLGHDTLDDIEVQALREFFLHEARESGDIPFMHEGCFVVPRPDDDDDDGNRCVVVVTPDGGTFTYWERFTEYPVAKAWFDAHPKEPPAPAWHSAKPGEVWDVTIEGKVRRCWVFESVNGTLVFAPSSGAWIGWTWEGVTDAVRVLEAPGEAS